MGMFGVGPTLGLQLIAEIGDVRHVYSEKALVGYAGPDAPSNDSGDVTGRHKSMSKIGASSLDAVSCHERLLTEGTTG